MEYATFVFCLTELASRGISHTIIDGIPMTFSRCRGQIQVRAELFKGEEGLALLEQVSLSDRLSLESVRTSLCYDEGKVILLFDMPPTNRFTTFRERMKHFRELCHFWKDTLEQMCVYA